MDSNFYIPNPQNCPLHNQNIVSYNNQNEALCITCILEQNNMIPIQKFEQQIQQAKSYWNFELDGQRKVLDFLLEKLEIQRQKMNKVHENLIHFVKVKIQSIDSSKKQLMNSQRQTNLPQQLKELEMELKRSKDNYLQYRNQIIKQLNDFEEQSKIDQLITIMNGYPNKREFQTDTIIHHEEIECDVVHKKLKVDQYETLNKFEYQLIQNQTIKQVSNCQAFAFNNINSILIVGCGKMIIIYEFNNGNIIKESQRTIKLNQQVNCLYFMNQTNSFVSGCQDKSIVIWQEDKNNMWIQKQILNDHENSINCLLMNQKEDLLISGSDDKQVKFWKIQNDNWSCFQSINIKDKVCAISLNELENKLILCGNLSSKIIVMEIKNDKQWSLIQEIDTSNFGRRLCFMNGDQLAFQPKSRNYLEIYNNDNSEKQFKKQQEVQIQCFYNCDYFFPCQFIKQLNIFIVKNGKQLNIFSVNQHNGCKLIQSIQFENHILFGRMTNDGEYLITWNEGSKEIQLRKLNKLE